jgi:hypothetical protein
MMYLDRTGRRVLLCGAIVALAGLLFHSRAPAQDLRNNVDPPKIDQAKPDASKQQPGRYQIIMHPTFRADQYLLDTVTGQIWQLTKFGTLQGEPEAWKFMTRLDNQSDYIGFIMSHPNKKPEGSEASAPPPVPPAAARAKPAAPMKLN